MAELMGLGIRVVMVSSHSKSYRSDVRRQYTNGFPDNNLY